MFLKLCRIPQQVGVAHTSTCLSDRLTSGSYRFPLVLKQRRKEAVESKKDALLLCTKIKWQSDASGKTATKMQMKGDERSVKHTVHVSL